MAAATATGPTKSATVRSRSARRSISKWPKASPSTFLSCPSPAPIFHRAPSRRRSRQSSRRPRACAATPRSRSRGLPPRRQFWLHGVLPVFLAGLLLGWIPVVGYLISIALMWASICIAFKRFHDVGYPGWYSLAYLVPLVGAGVALGVGFFEPRFLTTSRQAAQILAGLGVVLALAQLMFVYVRAGQEGPNQYGPD